MKSLKVLLLSVGSLGATHYHNLPVIYSENIPVEEKQYFDTSCGHTMGSSFIATANHYLSPLDALDLGVRTGNVAIIHIALKKLEKNDIKFDILPALTFIGNTMEDLSNTRSTGTWVAGTIGAAAAIIPWIIDRTSTTVSTNDRLIASGAFISFAGLIAYLNHSASKHVCTSQVDIIDALIASPACTISNNTKTLYALEKIKTYALPTDQPRINVLMKAI
jgi:hypothetical protein